MKSLKNVSSIKLIKNKLSMMILARCKFLIGVFQKNHLKK